MTVIQSELLDELLSGITSREDLTGDTGLFRQLKKALMERALGAELTHHWGYYAREDRLAFRLRAAAFCSSGHVSMPSFSCLIPDIAAPRKFVADQSRPAIAELWDEAKRGFCVDPRHGT